MAAIESRKEWRLYASPLVVVMLMRLPRVNKRCTSLIAIDQSFGAIEHLNRVQWLVDISHNVKEEPRHYGPLKGHKVPVLLENALAPSDSVERVVVLGDLAHNWHQAFRIINPIEEVVVVEQGGPVGFDVVGPDRGFDECIRQAIGKVVQPLDHRVKPLIGRGVRCEKFVLGDFGDEHVTDLPPADGRLHEEQYDKQIFHEHQILLKKAYEDKVQSRCRLSIEN